MISLEHIDQVIADGPYAPTWQSLATHPVPGWFPGAKFGIFTHWGVYTVPQFSNEWYPRDMYMPGSPAFDHHRAVYGPQKDFGYKDLVPLFTAPAFDPAAWLDLFKRAGAEYYSPVAEHHDGFQMYPSSLSHWNAAEMGPRRDVIGQLRQATLAAGLHFAVSSHRAEHWWFMSHGKGFDSDVWEPLVRGDLYWPAMPEGANDDIGSRPAPSPEFREDWLLRTCELIEQYRPELLYFDWWVQHEAFKEPLRQVAAFYYNLGAAWGQPVSIVYKHDALAWGTGIVDVERGGYAQPKPFVWQTDTSVARNSWCYTDSLEYKPVEELLITLVDTVSKNGNLLLNVGPRADGSIAPHDAQILEAIGRWLTVNGEGVYGTVPYKWSAAGPTLSPEGMFSEGSKLDWTPADVRYTAKAGSIYAFFLAPDRAEQLVLQDFAAWSGGAGPVSPDRAGSFNGVIRSVEQLGAGPVPFARTAEGLRVTRSLTAARRAGLPVGYPVGFKIQVG